MGWHDCDCNSAFPTTRTTGDMVSNHVQGDIGKCTMGWVPLLTNMQRVHRWPRGKAVKSVQCFLDPIQIQARLATGVQLEDETGDKKKGLRLEHTAGTEWVKSDGWDCIADHLEQDGPW